MIVKLFILGHPGSGKSTVSRYIKRYIKQKCADFWAVRRINDYDILLKMSKRDKIHNQFHLTEHKGFIVINRQKYAEALKKVERKALKKLKEMQISYPSKNMLVLIEFARKDYHEALENFTFYFLENAFFVFLDVDIETCKSRVHHRVEEPKSSDDHFVHESVLESYRDIYPRQYIDSQVSVDFGLPKDRIISIDNNGIEKDFEDTINRFIDLIFEQASDNLVVIGA